MKFTARAAPFRLWAARKIVSIKCCSSPASCVFSNANNPLAPYSSQSGSVVNADGFLGLTRWFDAASKLTVGYRADAHFKDTTSLGLGGTPPPQNQDRLDHGPVVRFTIQK